MLDRIDNKLKSLEVCRHRKKTPTYREVVFLNKDIKKWNRMLNGSLGSPVNPKWNNPDKKVDTLARKYGGLRKGQTLYLKEFEDFSIIAMIWPWKDRRHSTLKLSLIH